MMAVMVVVEGCCIGDSSDSDGIHSSSGIVVVYNLWQYSHDHKTRCCSRKSGGDSGKLRRIVKKAMLIMIENEKVYTIDKQVHTQCMCVCVLSSNVDEINFVVFSTSAKTVTNPPFWISKTIH